MTDNPRVNRYLRDKAFDNMDHALGRHLDPAGETFRNYFATEAGGKLAQQFDASPWWALSGVRGDMAYYHVTDAGIAALKAHLAVHAPIRAFVVSFDGYSSTVTAKSASAAKYDYWLDISDIYSDLTFIEFCRSARVSTVPALQLREGRLEMRRLDRTEENALAMIARIGGRYCPSTDALAEPFIMDTHNALVRKKRLSVSAEDGAPPMFTLTSLGREEAENGCD